MVTVTDADGDNSDQLQQNPDETTMKFAQLLSANAPFLPEPVPHSTQFILSEGAEAEVKYKLTPTNDDGQTVMDTFGKPLFFAIKAFSDETSNVPIFEDDHGAAFFVPSYMQHDFSGDTTTLGSDGNINRIRMIRFNADDQNPSQTSRDMVTTRFINIGGNLPRCDNADDLDFTEEPNDGVRKICYATEINTGRVALFLRHMKGNLPNLVMLIFLLVTA